MHTTEETWQLQRQVSGVRRERHRLTETMARNELATDSIAWSRRVTLKKVASRGLPWLLRASGTKPHLHKTSGVLCKQLRKACRSARDAHIEPLASTISTAPSCEALQRFTVCYPTGIKF